MPALAPVAHVLRVIAKQEETGADQNVLNRFFINYAGSAPSVAQLNTFAAAVATAWDNNMGDIQNTNHGLIEISVEDLTSATAAVGAAVAATFGDLGGTQLTNAVAGCLSFQIPRRYRGGHPRIYLMCGDVTKLATNNTWTGAFITAVEAAWVAFIAAVIAAGWAGAGTLEQVNVSYFHGFTNFTFPSGRTKAIPTPRVAPLVDVVSGVVLNPHLASQRRRNQQGT
jgi:hypothetical protein